MVRPPFALLVVTCLGAGCQRSAAPPAPAPPTSARTTGAVDGVAPAQPTLRLPRNFVPTSYAARLELDPAKAAFAGSISIAGVIDQRSAVIWLHGKNLAVHRATATKESEEIPLRVTARGEDLLELRATASLEPGAWTLMLDYTGALELRSTAGAFKQTVGADAYIYTQLEAIYARRVFPCVDEPDNKVPWKLTLDVPSKLVAVANTPVLSEAPIAGGKKRVEFAVSRPLPSYLVAFGVGPFEIVDAGTSKRGTPVRIITLANRSADAAHAASTSARLLDLAEDWFGTPYPYEKLDMLAIPLTIGFGAMENAGLITYTETLILLDARASEQRKNWWAGVAAHEIAHQWFGNLVTMVYWDDIWLNEGFATWIKSKITTPFEPAWRDELSALETRNSALAADALVTARQVRQPIGSPDDILTAFDRITYDKGASVLGMFESYLGPEVFQRGVREYLATMAWKNATSTDFVVAISKASGVDLEAAFATFLEQPGAPEISATTSCTGAPTVTLAQRRYLPPGANPPAPTRPWIVPVCIAYEAAGKRAQQCTLLDRERATITLDSKACPRWVMPNVDGRGYYRSLYTSAQLTALRDLAWPKLTPLERRAMFFDAREAAATDRLPLTLALSLVPKLLAGGDRHAISSALGLPLGLDGFVPAELRPAYEHWVRTMFGPAARAVGLTPRPSDTLDTESSRSALVGAVAWTGREPALIAEGAKLAAQWRELPQAIRGGVLTVAVDADPGLFAKVLQDVRTEPDRARRQEMFGAIGSVRDPARQILALALVLDRTLDIRETLGLLRGGSTEATRAQAQAFFRANQAAILERLPRDATTGQFANLSGLFTSTCKAAPRAEIVDYVTRTFGSLAGSARVLAQNIEAMDQCIARRATLEPQIRTWLTGVKLPKPRAPRRR